MTPNEVVHSEEDVVVPPRSRLFRLAPVGMGTPLTESLASYVARLADAHGWSVQRLMRHHLFPQMVNRHSLRPSGRAYWAKQGRLVNGACLSTARWVDTLQVLTRRDDLQGLTLLNWRVLCCPQRAIRRHRAWCPRCFDAWCRRRTVVYEPLLWSVVCVTRCPVHRTVLEGICPRASCRATLPILDAQFRAGFCSRCFAWLGVSRNTPRSVRLVRYVPRHEWWVIEAVGDLIAMLGHPPPPGLIRAVPEVLRDCAVVWGKGSLKRLAQVVSMPSSVIEQWARSAHRPSLLGLLGLCFQLRVTPHSLFTSAPGSRLPGTRRIGRSPLPPWVSGRIRVQAPGSVRALPAQLKRILARTGSSPPTLPAVSKEVGCESRYLLARYPALCRTIRRRAQHDQHRRAAARIKQLSALIRRATQVLYRQGRYPSARQVQNVLKKPALFKHPTLAEVWREAKRQLGITVDHAQSGPRHGRQRQG